MKNSTNINSGGLLILVAVGLAAHTVLAQGQPTTHRKRTGEAYVDPHGPYTINTADRTCTCPAFANRGGCCHLPAAMRWLAAWERGESVLVRTVSLSKQLIALRETLGSRYHVDTETRRIVVFRDWEAAEAYWNERPALVESTELVELRSVDLEELAATGRYSGLCLTLADGERQPIPLPTVDWVARREDNERE